LGPFLSIAQFLTATYTELKFTAVKSSLWLKEIEHDIVLK